MDKTANMFSADLWQDERQGLSLDGVWGFKHESQSSWHELSVPNAWQISFPELCLASGNALYRKVFILPEGWAESAVYLCFGAVNYLAVVRLNGQEIGRHEGGYLPFELVLPEILLRETNEITVDVGVPDGRDSHNLGPAFDEIPHGKQSWYGPLGGIWQSVYLEARDKTHIRQIRTQATLASNKLTLSATLSSQFSGQITVELENPDGTLAEQHVCDVNDKIFSTSLRVADVRAWSPEQPNLYLLKLTLRADGQILDHMQQTVGFRHFETRDGQFYLNGQPFYMRAALDQDYYPDGGGTVPDTALLEDQLMKAKRLGLNMLRCHIKVPDPRYFEVADRLGMLIWTEIPNVDVLTKASRTRLRDTMEGILARDGHHPSIVIWSIINEDWGTRLVDQATDRAWLKETFDWLKSADSGRLVVDNSACVPNFHVKTDINDYHYYRSLPERRDEWDTLTKEFAAGADWTYAPTGDIERRGDEPLVVSEFGVWGLPDPEQLKQNDKDPWWFEYGDQWGEGAALPHGIEIRYNVLNLDRVFGSFERFIAAAQWHQFANLKYEIESMRQYASIAGYVVTQLTDVHWEANGLMDMSRNLRGFADEFAAVNGDIVILPSVGRWAYWAWETVPVGLKIASGGRAIPAGATLRWAVENGDFSGQLDLPAIDALVVEGIAEIGVPLPALTASEMVEFKFEIVDPQGGILAQNELSVAVYPDRSGNLPGLIVASDDPKISARLQALGYVVAGVDESADVFVTRQLSDARVAKIQAGQKVLLLADNAQGHLRSQEPTPEPPHGLMPDTKARRAHSPQGYFPGLKVTQRDGTLWRGDWITNFSWLAREGAFGGIPGGPMLDLCFDRVVPLAVIDGFRPWEFNSRVHAGVVVGWVHKPAAFIFEKTHGEGKLVATTFRLMEDPGMKDPTATALFDALLTLATN